MGPVPKNVIFLTADAFGVLPPIARLTPEQAMYHFLSGYTAKVAGTEIGVTEPEATFSTCFGAPVHAALPLGLRQPAQGADRQGRRVAAGWSTPAGPAANMASAAGCRSRRRARCSTPRSTAASPMSSSAPIPNFGFEVPVSVPGVDAAILDPRGTWADKADYDATAAKLVDLFTDNFARFADHVDQAVRDAAPRAGGQQAQQTREPVISAA